MADLDLVALAVYRPVLPVWKSNFWVPHAIDASSSPQLHLLDGVEVHEGPRNSSQDNLTHCLISTQVSASRTSSVRPCSGPSRQYSASGASRDTAKIEEPHPNSQPVRNG